MMGVRSRVSENADDRWTLIGGEFWMTMRPCMARRRAPGAKPSASCPNMPRTVFELDVAALRASRTLPSTPFMEAHYFQNDCFMKPDQLMTEADKLAGIPGIIVQGRYDLLCPPATRMRWRRNGRTRKSA